MKPIYDHPRIFEVIDFLSEEECDHLIDRAAQLKKVLLFQSSFDFPIFNFLSQ